MDLGAIKATSNQHGSWKSVAFDFKDCSETSKFTFAVVKNTSADNGLSVWKTDGTYPLLHTNQSDVYVEVLATTGDNQPAVVEDASTEPPGNAGGVYAPSGKDTSFAPFALRLRTLDDSTPTPGDVQAKFRIAVWYE